ncbi:MAG TPA: hypothetical protein VIZ31_10515 [Vicinamibacteria bacterium]
MQRKGERGAAQVSSIISLLALVALAWAAWNVGPLYLDHYDFVDKVNEIARTPKYKVPTDDKVADMVMKEVRERRLDEYIAKGDISISTTETSRRIDISYERTAKVLPGWERTFEFNIHSDQPLI